MEWRRLCPGLCPSPCLSLSLYPSLFLSLYPSPCLYLYLMICLKQAMAMDCWVVWTTGLMMLKTLCENIAINEYLINKLIHSLIHSFIIILYSSAIDCLTIGSFEQPTLNVSK